VKSTIRVKGQRFAIEAKTGVVFLNGERIEPHEAYLLGSEIQRAAATAAKRSDAYVSKYLGKVNAA